MNKFLQNLPTNKKDFEERKKEAEEALKKLFASKTTGNDQAGTFLEEIEKLLENKFNKIEDEMKTKNSQETKAFIKR